MGPRASRAAKPTDPARVPARPRSDRRAAAISLELDHHLHSMQLDPELLFRAELAGLGGEARGGRGSTEIYLHASMECATLSSVVDRVAVITDIHANLPALQAALARIEELAIDAVYCGGDLVGYGPHPNEVCALVAELEIPTIYGNYDHAIARDLEDCGCAYRDQHDRELGQQSVAWTLANTDRRSKDWMRELPFDVRFPVGSTAVHLVHGSPRKVNEYLFEDKPARLYERLAADEDADVLVFGHTHKPWTREHGGVLFVNCGSVGKPKDGDPRAAFAVLDEGSGELHVSIERVAYDAGAVAAEVRSAGLPGEYAERLVLAA